MIWKRKLFVVPFFVFVSLLFLVFGFSQNANAAARNVTGFKLGGNTFNAYSGTNNSIFYYRLIDNTAYDGKNMIRLDNPIFTFNSTFTTNKHNGILLDFYVAVKNSLAASDSLIAAPSCPPENTTMYQGSFRIAECTAEVVSRQSVVDKWNVNYQSSSSAYDEIFTDGSTDTTHFFHYRIIAYSDTDSTVTINSFSLYGPLLVLGSNTSNVANRSIIHFLFNFAINGISINEQTPEEKMNDKDDQDRQDIENQTSDTQDGADESSAQAQATGTTLMGAFSSFVTALASVHETNCNLPSFSIYGMNFNNMNLCTFDVPSGIIALATIGMVFIIVPLSFHLVRRLINIFRSFSG